jgi:hypothetical protein
MVVVYLAMRSRERFFADAALVVLNRSKFGLVFKSIDSLKPSGSVFS